MVIGTTPTAPRAQSAPPAEPAPPVPARPPGQPGEAEGYRSEQLDALLAPIALYPDELLTQILMASTFPLQVVEAGRWVEDPANKALTGDALTRALARDPGTRR